MWPIARRDQGDVTDARRRGTPIDPLLIVLAALAIALSPFPAIFVELTQHPKFYLRVLVLLTDPLLAAIVVLGIARATGRPVRVPAWMAAAGIAVVWLALSLVVQPSLIGAQLVARQAAMVALAFVIAVVAGRRELVVFCGVAAAAAIAQGVLALAQLLRGGPLGLPQLGEFADELLRVGGALAPRGTMSHPYVLAGLALVGAGACLMIAFRSRRPVPWLVLAALAIAPVGVTYSRTAALGLAVAGACLVPKAVRGSVVHRAALAALILGAGIPAALAPSGWAARVESTVTRVPDRGTLIVQAARITARSPVLGVGPGRYDDALADLREREPDSVSVFQEPHSVPVVVAAEGGLLAGLALLAGILLLLREAWRAGPETVAAYALFAPFLFLEHYPYSHAQGAVILGTWLGLVAAWSRPAATGHEMRGSQRSLGRSRINAVTIDRSRQAVDQ